MTLVDTYFQDEVSVFEYNAAIRGGAINCDACEINLIGTYFTYNTAYRGGAIYLQNSAYMYVKLAYFEYNHATDEAGALYLTQLSYIDAVYC